VYPKILDHEKYGEQARKIFADANAMLDQFIADGSLTARAVYGFFPANRDGDDLIVWTDETRTTERTRLHHLRQQVAKDNANPYRCLADFVAPIPPVAADMNRRAALRTGEQSKTDHPATESARAFTSAATEVAPPFQHSGEQQFSPPPSVCSYGDSCLPSAALGLRAAAPYLPSKQKAPAAFAAGAFLKNRTQD
jgi:hypothetical protein